MVYIQFIRTKGFVIEVQLHLFIGRLPGFDLLALLFVGVNIDVVGRKHFFAVNINRNGNGFHNAVARNFPGKVNIRVGPKRAVIHKLHRRFGHLHNGNALGPFKGQVQSDAVPDLKIVLYQRDKLVVNNGVGSQRFALGQFRQRGDDGLHRQVGIVFDAVHRPGFQHGAGAVPRHAVINVRRGLLVLFMVAKDRYRHVIAAIAVKVIRVCFFFIQIGSDRGINGQHGQIAGNRRLICNPFPLRVPADKTLSRFFGDGGKIRNRRAVSHKKRKQRFFLRFKTDRMVVCRFKNIRNGFLPSGKGIPCRGASRQRLKDHQRCQRKCHHSVYQSTHSLGLLQLLG